MNTKISIIFLNFRRVFRIIGICLDSIISFPSLMLNKLSSDGSKFSTSILSNLSSASVDKFSSIGYTYFFQSRCICQTGSCPSQLLFSDHGKTSVKNCDNLLHDCFNCDKVIHQVELKVFTRLEEILKNILVGN